MHKMRVKAKMEARGKDMKNETKSLKSVKESCMQCFFAGDMPLAELRSSLIKLSQSLMHGANPWRGEEMKKKERRGGALYKYPTE